jgi:NAD(P)-dependent dehydrogenase (short-subunit alcohol dehydrogenase family)
VWTYCGDVSDPGAVETFVQGAVSRFGTIDILVNNAGALADTPVADPDDAAWDLMMRTNLDAPYFLTTRAEPHMPDGGRIVFVSGVLGKVGIPGSSGYCATKHGIIGFARAIALELASRKITVNAVCPGWVDTDLARSTMEKLALATGVEYEDFRKSALDRVPMGEMILPDEVAELVCFLVGPSGRNITGQSYNICGGQVMH